MELVTERLNGIVFGEAWSRVDGTNARDFEVALRNAIAEEDRALIIDFEHLKYISSAGLRAILLTAKLLQRRNAGFGICFLSEPIREVFEISGFDKIISIYASRAEALAALGP